MRKNCAALLMVICLAAASGAQAQEVIFTGEKCPLNTVNSQDGVTQNGEAQNNGSQNEVLLDRVDILGLADGDKVAVHYTEEGEDVFAMTSLEDVMNKIPGLDVSAVPSVIDWTDLDTGSSGELTKAIQEAMVSKGLLKEDGADGQYGPGTAAAVSEFQIQNGLPANGKVDIFTYFMLVEEDSEPLTTEYPPVFNAEEKFASIYEHVENPDVLEAFKDSGWSFSYDPFDGHGELTRANGYHIGTWTDDSTQIDRLKMDVDLIVYVYQDEEGVVKLVPAFKVSSIGACRPYVEGIALKSGDDVSNLPVLVCEGKIEGTDLSETAIVPFTEVEYMDEGDHNILRIIGANRDYEMEFEVTGDIAVFQIDS